MVCPTGVPKVKTNTRRPASPGKKWGKRTAPVGPSEVDSGASREISSSGSPPRAGIWYNTCGGPLLNTITSPSGLQEPPLKSSRQLAKPNRQPALHRDLLEFVARGKSDEVAAWRPKGRPCPLGALDLSRLLLIEILDPQSQAAGAAGRDMLPVRRDGRG